MKEWFWIIDVEKCENCHNCFLACRDEHSGNQWPGYALPQGENQKWIHIEAKERGRNPFIDVAYLPMPCMHCDDAPCVRASGNGAIYKRKDGIVVIDPVKAKGQKKLVKACPYNEIWWNEQLGLPQKCTFCAHLIDEGWGKSRCVQACPTGALSMIQAAPAEMQRIIKEQCLEVLKPELKTAPRVFYKNLFKFTRCFIGGTIAFRDGETEDCAEGARVTLFSSENSKIAECLADNYGDFKFDNLPENSGKYYLEIKYKSLPVKRLEVEVAASIYTGVIIL